MFFTDCQLWNSLGGDNTLASEWNNYKAKINPNAKLYLFDLTGYGNTPVKIIENNVFLIAGWSEKIFDVLKALESGEDALNHINSIDL